MTKRKLYKVKDAAFELSFSPRYILMLIQRGELETVGAGRSLRVIGDSLDRFIERHRNTEREAA